MNPNHSIIMPGKRNLSQPSIPSFPLSSSPSLTMSPRNKKLRRLPHVFSKVLELPFSSNVDVSVEDFPDRLRFVADEGNGVVVGAEVRTNVIEVHPGIINVVVIRLGGNRSQSSIDDVELDLWRFRLPAAAKPELSKAFYNAGKLVVMVPKTGWGENKRCRDDFKGGSFRGDNMGSLLVV